MLFKDRHDAGSQLAQKLLEFRGKKDVLVVGLARGGVCVAAEVATCLHLPLNVFVVRKIGAPINQELAIGAIAESGEVVLNDELIACLSVSQAELFREMEIQKKILAERIQLYRGQIPSSQLSGKTVLLVDDGVATGASIRCAVLSLRFQGVQAVILAVPVASSEALCVLTPEVDGVVCLHMPDKFNAVGEYYQSFLEVSDEQVAAIYQNYAKRRR